MDTRAGVPTAHPYPTYYGREREYPVWIADYEPVPAGTYRMTLQILLPEQIQQEFVTVLEQRVRALSRPVPSLDEALKLLGVIYGGETWT